MNRLARLAFVVLILAGVSGLARAQTPGPAPGETDVAFATRALHLPSDAEPHVTAVSWNGVATLVVDYPSKAEDPERVVTALQRLPSGGYRTIQVTVGEQEGGTPDLLALGLANADHDPAKELILILAWPQQHYDVEGTLYEVRIFDDPKPGQDELAMLKLSDRFGSACDCRWRDGASKHYRFKTIAEVRAQLKRWGY